MPINEFGSISANTGNRTDTSLFERKPYLRTNHIESIIEEDIDMKKQYGNKNLNDAISIREAAAKIYVDTLFNAPTITKTNCTC